MVASQNRTTYSFTSRITRTSLYIVFYDKWIAIWFVVINLCFNHFNEKTCWTSEILGENSWKNLTFVVDEFFFRRQAPPTKPLQPAHQSKQQLSRIFSKNLWSSAGFLIEIVKTKIDHHKILDNFCLGIFVLKILWVFILIIKLHACCLKVKINYKNTLCKTSSSKFTTFWKI